MVEVEIAHALDAILLLPFLGRPVGTGLREAVQDGEEDRPLHGELELSFSKKAKKYRAHAGFFPETTKYQRNTYLLIPGRGCCSSLIAVEKGKLLRILDARTKEVVQGTRTLELIESSHRCKHLLPDLPLFSPVLYNLEIFSRA